MMKITSSLSIRILFLIVLLSNEFIFSNGSVVRRKREGSIRTQIDKPLVQVHQGDRFEITCTSYTTDRTIEIKWINPYQEVIEGDHRVTIITRYTDPYNTNIESTLIIDRLEPSDIGLYQCIGFNDYGEEPAQFNVVRANDPPSRRECDIHEATCRNGQCIPRTGLCDGITDCSDGSDELSCSSNRLPGKCEPNEKACRNGHCLQKFWYCDGEPDCEDKSDESECSSLPSDGICKGHEFACKNRQQCVLKSFLCDKENDCSDFSDEMGCEPPRILQYPVRNLTVCLGSTFTIECKAAGFPAPFINWRLNWGHTCEENEKDRCYSTNANGHGVFTANNAKYHDAGAYSCEAINSMGRIFAIPDTIVTIHHCEIRLPITTQRQTTPRPITTPQAIRIDEECPMCNKHSNECTCSGICRNCQHNTEGEYCDRCKQGYYGDAKRGTPYDCVPKPIILPPITYARPTTTRTLPRTTSYEVNLDVDGCNCYGRAIACTCSGRCINCTQNTMGESCNQCKPEFYAIGDEWNLRCEPIKSNFKQSVEQIKKKECNSYGTAHETQTSCKCKSGVTGQYCDECKPRYYNLLSDNNKQGCLSCFCNGLSVDCKSSDLYYRKKISYFENEDWYISNKYTNLKENVKFIQNGILFDNIKSFNSEELYFIGSSQFKGNHLLSYNGELSFIFKYELSDNRNTNIQPLEIRISGTNINLIHTVSQNLLPNVENQITVKINEDSFVRYGDRNKIQKEFFLMALSNIDLIMIKAKLSKYQKSASINGFYIEYADLKSGVAENKANSVEVCSCPIGYFGSSCEECAFGYKRSNEGFFWGKCVPL